MERPKLPRLAQNSLSTAGAIISVVIGLILIILLSISLTGMETNAYSGILIFMVLPVLLVLGLLL
ncbi:MAG: hypothetical protein E4G91_02440, partial [Candidatus Zixiibacteriota bacterium]